MGKFRNVGKHAVDIDGRLVHEGEEVTITAEQLKDVNINQLVEDEVLIPSDVKTSKEKSE